MMQPVVVKVPPKRERPKSTGRTEGFYGPGELWDRIEKAAEKLGRSKSDLVVGILSDWLEEFEADERKS